MRDDKIYMPCDEVRRYLAECCSDMEFDLDGIHAGVLISVENSVPTYLAFWGDNERSFHNVDDLMQACVFNRKSLIDLCGHTEFWFL